MCFVRSHQSCLLNCHFRIKLGNSTETVSTQLKCMKNSSKSDYILNTFLFYVFMNKYRYKLWMEMGSYIGINTLLCDCDRKWEATLEWEIPHFRWGYGIDERFTQIHMVQSKYTESLSVMDGCHPVEPGSYVKCSSFEYFFVLWPAVWSIAEMTVHKSQYIWWLRFVSLWLATTLAQPESVKNAAARHLEIRQKSTDFHVPQITFHENNLSGFNKCEARPEKKQHP